MNIIIPIPIPYNSNDSHGFACSLVGGIAGILIVIALMWAYDRFSWWLYYLRHRDDFYKKGKEENRFD
jgi:hypothetical protein